MAAAFELGLEPQLEDLVGQAEGDDAPAHRQHVGVVVLRDSRAVNRSLHSAARAPRTLLAASCSPWPLPPSTMPRSASPRTTARATAAQKGG